MLVHHVLFTIIVLTARDTHPVELAYGLLAELTNIPMNIGWFMIQTNSTDSFGFRFVTVVCLLMYFLTRVVNFTVLVYTAMLKAEYAVVILGGILTAMNYYWFSLLVRKSYQGGLVNLVKKQTNIYTNVSMFLGLKA